MSRSKGFGKKGARTDFEELYPFSGEGKCLECGAEGTKLRTLTGKHFEDRKGKVLYNMYWVCLCPNGHGEYLTLDSVHEVFMYGK